jgi:hypothetical protein
MLTFEFPDLIQWVNSKPVLEAFTNVELRRSKFEKPKFLDLCKNSLDLFGSNDARKKLAYDCVTVGLGLSFFGYFLKQACIDA